MGSGEFGSGEGAAGGPVHPVLVAVGALREQVRAVGTAALFGLSDAEVRGLVQGLSEAGSMLEAARLAAIGELDARPAAVAGARAGQGAQAFLVHRVQESPGRARQDVAAARAVDPRDGSLPHLGAALATGAVRREHLDVGVRALARIPAHLLGRVDGEGATGAQRVDAYLTEQAHRFGPHTLDRLARHLLAVLDPDGSERFDPNAYTRRALSMATDCTGMLVGRFQLDPASGVIVKTALAHYGAPTPATTARTDTGQDVAVGDDRSHPQRLADALTTVCRQALNATTAGGATAPTDPPDPPTPAAAAEAVAPGSGSPGSGASGSGPPGSGPPGSGPPGSGPPGSGSSGSGCRAATHVLLIAEVDAATGSVGPAEDTATGPLPPGVFARLACDAVLHPVHRTPAGAILDLGRSVRTVTPAQRRALIARDHGCIIPGCTAPLTACDAHHVTWWRHGGPTSLANLTLLCASHHTAVHTGIWQVQITDGVPWAIPPPWIDPHRTLLRNGYPQAVHHAHRLARQLHDQPPLPCDQPPLPRDSDQQPDDPDPPPGKEGSDGDRG